MNFSLACTALLALTALTAFSGCQSNHPNPDPTVGGTLNYTNFVVTPGCTVEIRLDDVSVADAPATTIARETINPREASPLPFELHYNPKTIHAANRYVIFAKISCGDELMFAADPSVPVLTQGNPTFVNVVLKRITKVR